MPVVGWPKGSRLKGRRKKKKEKRGKGRKKKRERRGKVERKKREEEDTEMGFEFVGF